MAKVLLHTLHQIVNRISLCFGLLRSTFLSSLLNILATVPFQDLWLADKVILISADLGPRAFQKILIYLILIPNVIHELLEVVVCVDSRSTSLLSTWHLMH